MRLLAVIAVLGCSSPPSPATPRQREPEPVPATPAKQPTKSTDVVVTITATDVLLNGTRLGGKPMLGHIVAAIGKPDRHWDASAAANRIHTWDRLGILVYEPYDGRCISLTLPFRKLTQSFDPKMLFTGTVILDGKRMAISTRLADVKRWTGATTPYAPTSVVFPRGEVSVFTIEEKAGTGLDLVEIGFWKNAKPPPRGTAPPDNAKSLDLECRNGDARMCTRLALIFQTGADGDQDFVRAFAYAKLACDGGDAFGCTMLGNMHDAGRGTPKSTDAARTAWRRACTLGDPVGCDRSR